MVAPLRSPLSIGRRVLGSAAVALIASGCASTPDLRSNVPTHLFADHLFGAPSHAIDAGEIFALTDDMRLYLQTQLAADLRKRSAPEALVHALYKKRGLKLDYDSAVTRNAAEAFEARSGNCLSLVVMTAALAKELGLQVRYHSAYLEEQWALRGDLLLRSGHVNITLGARLSDSKITYPNALTVDFLPPEELRTLKTREISESVVVAMFMNNRAVEAMVDGHLDDAYAWTRAAIVRSPDFLAAQNTLGIVYMRRGASEQAAAAFEHLIARDADNTRALANLAEVRTRQGRLGDAARLRQRLAQLEPEAPLHHYKLGLEAMERKDYFAARDHFAKEAARSDAPPELYYRLSLVYYRLGDFEQAAKELNRAAQASASRSDRDLYSAKLAWLRAVR